MTPDEIKQTVKHHNVTFIPNHDCALCNVSVGYVIEGDNVSYKSACACGWSPNRVSSFEEIANWFNAQRSSDGIMHANNAIRGYSKIDGKPRHV